jgi:hypothetical protein
MTTPNHSNQPVTRIEFSTAVRHLETILGQQTLILQSLAVGAAENRARDEKFLALVQEVKRQAEEQGKMKERFAWLTGAGAVLMAAWPIFAKKLGIL